MKAIRKFGRAIRVIGVLIVAVVVGALGLSDEPGKANRASTTTTTGRVDVGETEHGQPASRNYLE